MRTEDDLRAELRMSAAASSPTEASHSIDTASMLARSRQRRRPRQLALSATVGLAIAGIGIAGLSGIPGILGLQGFAPGSASESAEAPAAPQDEAGEIASGATGGDISRAPAEKVNACGGALAEVAADPSGLTLEPVFSAAVPAGPTVAVEGVVRLTNTGVERITGTTPVVPAVTVSQDGLVLWHTNGPSSSATRAIDLGPGESLEYPASFVPVRCEIEDDAAESFRSDLPPLPAGGYQVSALLDFTPSAPDAVPTLVGGPTSAVTLS